MMKPDVCDFTCLEVDEEIKRYVFFSENTTSLIMSLNILLPSLDQILGP